MCDAIIPRAWVTLDWDDQANLDLDLHLLRPDGEYGTDEDCHYRNRQSDWCNPGLSADARGGDSGSFEQVRLIDPPEWLFTVAVVGYNRQEGPATVELHCGGNPPVRFGPVDFGEEQAFWEVFQFNPRDCVPRALDAWRDGRCWAIA